MGELAAVEDGMSVGTFGDRGWEPPETLFSPEEMEVLISAQDRRVRESMRKASRDLWQLADILIHAEQEFGETRLEQWVPDHDFARRTYLNIMRIGRAFREKKHRWDPAVLSFWSHGEVASVAKQDPSRATVLLAEFAGGILTRDDLRREVAAHGGRGGSGTGVPGGDDQAASAAQTTISEHLDTCPLCLGAGSVPHKSRAAYLSGERPLQTKIL